jgi:acyl phosphate:glycerol-3-phosphate acyltransferase
MEILVWTIISFLCGSIPFSVILGRLVTGEDIRQYGDHNPGAANVAHSAGKFWSFIALLLDGLKGAIPVGLAYFSVGIQGWGIVPIALAPIFGHAFSPFLRFRGGKALSTTFGIWLGTTLYVGPTVLGLCMGVMYTLLATSAWAVLFSMLAFGAFVVAYYRDSQPAFLVIWLVNFLLLLYKHRQELVSPPRLRPRWLQLIKK